MREVWDFDKCVLNFNQEIALLQRISLIQDSICSAVITQEWMDFDWKISELNQMGNDFNLLESERNELFIALKEKFHVNFPEENDMEASFLDLAARLPQDEGRLLSELFRELKVETFKLKTQNNTFTGYLNEIRTITAALLDVFLPLKNGKLYNRKGLQTAGDLRSMVLNRHI